jgi:PAS domain S-box-containing protein
MPANLTELILDRAHNAVVSLDERGLITYWNPSAERMFGRTREAVVGTAAAELIIPERFRAAHHAGLRRFLDSGVGPILDQRIELAALRADGSEFPVEMTVSALQEEEHWRFTAFIQDITEREEGQRERERLVEELRRTLQISEQRFDAVVGSLSDPVTIRDREHRFLYANQAAVVHLGFDSWEQLRGTSPASIMSDYLVWGEDGREIAMEDIPSVRIMRGEPAEPLLIRTVNRTTGQLRWNLLKAAPLPSDDGVVEATITIIEDVTEQKRSELQSTFLAEASAELATSLDYEQTLRKVARLAVPDMFDWCAVDLLDEEGDRRTVAVAHVDPDRLKLAEALRDYMPDRLDPREGLGRVLRTGESELYPEITEEMLAQAAADDRHLELLRTVGFRSALIVPMRLGERILGALTLVSAESVRVLDQTDMKLAEELAARAAVAIENSRLYSERSSIARTLQQSLLPAQLPEMPGYELASIYLPAIETSMVGGDFYDVWPIGEDWMVVIGDVTGKGVAAAALTALVRNTLRTASEFESSPARLLALVDRTLKKRGTLSICTALCMRVADDHLTLSVGGHPLPLQITADGVEPVGRYGPLLGGFPNAHWEDVELSLQAGSTILAYTDGITDALDEHGGRFGVSRLCDTLEALAETPVADLMTVLSQTLEGFQAGAHFDDTAAIALRPLPGDPDRERQRFTHERSAADTITVPSARESDGKTNKS